MAWGVSSAREWATQDFVGARAGPVWAEVWHIATANDFYAGQIHNDAELMNVLATSDDLEMKLRRLSSLIYEANHGDAAGAAAMLAISNPHILPYPHREGRSRGSSAKGIIAKL